MGQREGKDLCRKCRGIYRDATEKAFENEETALLLARGFEPQRESEAIEMVAFD